MKLSDIKYLMNLLALSSSFFHFLAVSTHSLLLSSLAPLSFLPPFLGLGAGDVVAPANSQVSLKHCLPELENLQGLHCLFLHHLLHYPANVRRH